MKSEKKRAVEYIKKKLSVPDNFSDKEILDIYE